MSTQKLRKRTNNKTVKKIAVSIKPIQLIDVGDTFKLEVDADEAREFLAKTERNISEAMRDMAKLSERIEKLTAKAKKIREQLGDLDRSAGRVVKQHGQNREQIIAYLGGYADARGATLSEIAKATSMQVSSAAYTMKKNPKDFAFDKVERRWKLNR